MKDLDNEQLVDRLEQVDNQATIIRWMILWELRKRFSSDKLFGQYLAELKKSNATITICDSSHQQIFREISAGRFCERNNVTNIASIGILKSAIYALSKPSNEDISDNIFQEIKNRNIPVNEVNRLIAQAKAITIDHKSAEEQNSSIQAIGAPLVVPKETIALETKNTEKTILTNKEIADYIIQFINDQNKNHYDIKTVFKLVMDHFRKRNRHT
ncbi:hypothetical protein AADEFJLK_04649 [Methylovulum psychrotolerans]|uniref:Uncharacterized protein n=1 Tax=Methylovulum psychrotolerans TaxID=1704499 RepID=A0A2S5CFJ7_9GAMM|nr:hypothetical protein AADEFJLK_04649 [Methylovulum psychrotolerans]